MSSTTQNQADGKFVEHRQAKPRSHSKEFGWAVFLIIVTILMALGWIATSSQKFYKPGDNIGYNMGLVGGIMLLTLLLYPLRKRVRFLNGIGLLPAWFKWHMIFGILAPALILFHSTFRIGSINAGMALVAMLLVSGSGIFGRFFYTKIHNGLYGRQASLKELQDDMNQTGNVKANLKFAPEIVSQLEKFASDVGKVTQKGNPGFIYFIRVGIQATLLSKSLTKSLQQAMLAQIKDKNWSETQLQRLDVIHKENKTQIENYIHAVRDVAQFHTYERLFSLWHIFHIPLVYLLVFSGIFHVVSVHMY